MSKLTNNERLIETIKHVFRIVIIVNELKATPWGSTTIQPVEIVLSLTCSLFQKLNDWISRCGKFQRLFIWVCE